MKKEDLIALGLTEELSDAVLKAYQTESDDYVKEIDRLEKENKTLKANEMTKEKLEELKQKEYERGKGEVQKEFESFKNEQLLSGELAKAGVRNPKTIASLLDMDKITYENGEVKGLSEQLEAIRAENDFLFASEKEEKPGFLGNGGAGGELTKEAFAKMGYSERNKLYNENPELYQELSGKN